jgi:hypothetical protein
MAWKRSPGGHDRTQHGTLYYGDNLEVLRQYVPDDSVDLVYLDPPFQSGKNYNILFESRDGQKSAAQIQAFEDTWTWSLESEASYREIVEGGGPLALTVKSLRQFLGESDILAYLCMMAIRLIELRRVLKPTGSLYLHCDPTASHYLKVLLDALFGPACFRNEVNGRYRRWPAVARQFQKMHDVLLFYSKSAAGEHKFQTLYGYESLAASTLKTFGTIAHRLNRRWIGIDITHLAIGLVKHRLLAGFGSGIDFEVIGEPNTVEDARQLAGENPHQFEWWILGQVGARPAEKKLGADRGIDGRLFFHDEGSRGTRTKQIVISVKAGKVMPVHEPSAAGDRGGEAKAAAEAREDSPRNLRPKAGSEERPVRTGWPKTYPAVRLLTRTLIWRLKSGRRLKGAGNKIQSLPHRTVEKPWTRMLPSSSKV